MLYSKVAPVGAVIVMVPVGTGHVGCCVTLAVGAAGLAGMALMVMTAADAIQVVLVSCTVITLVLPGTNPANTGLIW